MIPFDLPPPEPSAPAKCRRCRRKISDPVSLGYQIGPDCRHQLGIDPPKKPPRFSARWSGPVEGQTDLNKINEGNEMATLDDLAPYPKTVDAVTTDLLARHMMVCAHAGAVESADLAGEVIRAEGTDRHGDVSQIYKRNLDAYTAEFGVAFLLQALAKLAPDKADGVARELWRRWDDAPMGGHTWEALEAYGIDPGDVEDVLSAGRGGAAGGDQ